MIFVSSRSLKWAYILTEEAHRTVVAFAMGLPGRFPKHNHHNETKESGNGGYDLHENADGGGSELTPGVKDRRVEAVDAGRRRLGIGHVRVVVLVADVLTRGDGGQTCEEGEGG